MTSHQDNAARLARIAQIAAVVVVVLAVGAFLISLPTEQLSGGSRAGQIENPLDGTESEQYRFYVPEQDWTTAVGPLSAARDPITVASNTKNGGPENGPEGTNPEDEDPTPPRPVAQNRPPIRYLGALGDGAGKAALIDFAGRQLFIRIGQEFENDYEITEITPEQIIVADGFNEFTIKLEPSSLANAIPNPPLNPAIDRARNRNTTNPNAFPGGRSTPPGRPSETPNEDEDGGSKT